MRVFGFSAGRWKSLACAVLLSLPISLSVNTDTRAAASGADTPIKIGFITSLSGAAKDMGQDMLNGINLYVDQVHGQMAGHQVMLIVENDASSPAAAAAAARQLIDERKVNLLDGVILAHVGLAVASVAEKEQTPWVDACAAPDDLTQRHPSKWIVRTSFSASQIMHPFGEYVYKKLHYKRVVAVGMDFPYGWEVVGGFQNAFEKAGGKVVQKMWVPLGFSNFSQQLQQIRKDADAIFVMVTGVNGTAFLKQYHASGIKLPIVANGSSFDETSLHEMGKEAVGAIDAWVYSQTLSNPANQQFVKSYMAKYGARPSSFAEYGYTSGMLIDKALAAVNGNVDNKQALMEALRQVELPNAPRGPLKLDAFGNPVENVYIFKVEQAGKGLQTKLIDTIPAVSQFWTWKPSEFLNQPVYSRDYPPCKFCSK